MDETWAPRRVISGKTTLVVAPGLGRPNVYLGVYQDGLFLR